MIKLTKSMQRVLEYLKAPKKLADDAAADIAEIDDTLQLIMLELRNIHERLDSMNKRMDIHQWLIGAVIIGIVILIIKGLS